MDNNIRKCEFFPSPFLPSRKDNVIFLGENITFYTSPFTEIMILKPINQSFKTHRWKKS